MSRRSSRKSVFNSKKEYTCSVYASNKGERVLDFSTTQDEWDGKWDKPVMYYKVIGECKTMSRKQIRRALNYAMTTWDIEIPIVFKPAWWWNKTPDITIDFKYKSKDKHFKDNPSVLAYAYFPEQGSYSGKVVFNNDYLWDYLGKGVKAQKALDKGWVENVQYIEGSLKTYSIIAVLIHELGHSLGLRHDVTGNTTGVDVMDAYYSGENRIELSVRDISRIVAKYGARVYSRWNHYNRLKKAIAHGKKRLIIR